MWKRIAIGFGLAIVLVVAAWSALVVSYESDLGTSNTVVVTFEPVGSNNSDDTLASLAFKGNDAENLSWASLQVSVNVDGQSFGCSFGSQSTASQSPMLVSPKLAADGLTFTTEIDATSETSFTHFALPEQGLGNETIYTMRFSKADVFFSEDVLWTYIPDITMDEDVEVNASELNTDSENRLDWYDYDLAVHRVDPKTGVYLIEQHGMQFKLQFLTYYNADDESRYPTIMIAALNGSDFPALNNPMLVSPSPCLIVAGDEDTQLWNGTETILLRENDQNIWAAGQAISVIATYEGVEIRIIETEQATVSG